MSSNTNDQYWQVIGKDDPYWGVLTDDRFRLKNLSQDSVEEFYSTGEGHVESLFETIRKHIDRSFRPSSSLDFGCGVGRVLIPLAKRCQQVVGIDLSDGMLDRARLRCESLGIGNVRLARSEQLSSIGEKFDLIHSFIVFQHIPPIHGYDIVGHLLRMFENNGVGVFHFLYHRKQSAPSSIRKIVDKVGLYPLASALKGTLRSHTDKMQMQMNPYDMNTIMHMLQQAGIHRFHAEYTDHDGALGVLLLFRKEGRDAARP